MDTETDYTEALFDAEAAQLRARAHTSKRCPCAEWAAYKAQGPAGEVFCCEDCDLPAGVEAAALVSLPCQACVASAGACDRCVDRALAGQD